MYSFTEFIFILQHYSLKKHLIIFKGLSIARNILRPGSAPLIVTVIPELSETNFIQLFT